MREGSRWNEDILLDSHGQTLKNEKKCEIMTPQRVTLTITYVSKSPLSLAKM